jgi:hypothetical protein
MQRTNQPQTTSNPTVRDAAVQIGAEGQNVSQEKTTGCPEHDKFDALITGAKVTAEARKDYRETADFRQKTSDRNFTMACQLAMIIANLTSSNRDNRERAKKEVRHLVKLGQENAE